MSQRPATRLKSLLAAVLAAAGLACGPAGEAKVVVPADLRADLSACLPAEASPATRPATERTAPATDPITGRKTTQTHNALNQLRSCSYDLDGNLTANGAWSYTWDAENRLTSAVSNGTTIATYQYDAQNRRIFKTVGTTTHQYLYDGWNLVAEVRSQGSAVSTNFYVWGADHTGSLATDSGGVRGLLAIISGASVYYPVMNNHGDVMALFDATGTNIVARYERDPFGVLLSAIGPAADACPFGFQTKYCDPETGLIYFGHRYYEPTLATWLCRDPLEEEGGVNLYGVTGGDPVNGIDPLGLTDSDLANLFIKTAATYIEYWATYKAKNASMASAAGFLSGGLNTVADTAPYKDSVWATSAVMTREMNNGASGLGAFGVGVNYQLGKILGYTTLTEGIGGYDWASNQELNGLDRGRYVIMGGGQLALMGTTLPAGGTSFRLSTPKVGSPPVPVSPSVVIASKPALAGALKGVTPQATRIAEGFENGLIKVNLLGDNLFDTWYYKLSERNGDFTSLSPQAFARGRQIYLRKSSLNLSSEAVHEGTHALDNLGGISLDDYVAEYRAYYFEREFQLSAGLVPELLTIDDVASIARRVTEDGK